MRKGFTLIEVILFLAMTAMLFVGVTVGTRNSIDEQKFVDATQNFAEFLRGVYASVKNTQSAGDGRSELAIYGKLVVFGESEGMEGIYAAGASGESLEKGINRDGAQKVYVYDVVADAEGASTGDATKVLKNLNANVVTFKYNDDGEKVGVELAGVAESYTPRWATWIETVENEPWTGSILIVRHPRSGVINTLVSSEVIEVNQLTREINDGAEEVDVASKILTSGLDAFVVREVDFCVDPSRDDGVARRRDVRLVKNARNASGVEVIDLDSDENRCGA